MLKTFCGAALFLHTALWAQPITVYTFGGLGSDHRVFANLKLDTDQFRLQFVPYPVPQRGETMGQYAGRLLVNIDTTEPFCMAGVSLGGMLITEMCKSISPQGVLLIASAKTRDELPLRYRFQKYVPVYRLFPGAVLKSLSFVAQPLFEPDRDVHKDVFVAMLGSRNPKTLKRQIGMIVRWDNKQPPPKALHLHGEKDHTLPARNIQNALVMPQCSHMMALVCGEQITNAAGSFFREACAP